MKICRVKARIVLIGITISLTLMPVDVLAENLALVIGVSSYGDNREAREEAGFIVPTKLPNAINDARLMHGALEAAGFSASLVEDPSRLKLLTVVNQFAKQLREAGPDALGFFYFAGHGTQGVPRFERDVDNFLMPVGTHVATETDLTDEAVGLSRISATLSGTGANAVILVLDACRNFALPSSNRNGAVTRGLAEARAYPGTMIAYSTAPGELASDGPRGGNGPYAEALAKEVRAARGTRVEDILISVRQQVLAATSNRQTPWENASLRAKVTIGEPLSSAGIVGGSSSIGPPLAQSEDQIVFANLERPCEYAMFARDYSSSPLVALAHARAATTPPCDVAASAAITQRERDTDVIAAEQATQYSSPSITTMSTIESDYEHSASDSIASENPMITLLFGGASWVEVYDSNRQKLLYGLVDPPAVKNLSGSPPLSVFLGRQNVVRVEINGEPYVIPQQALKGNTARFQIAGPISADSLAGRSERSSVEKHRLSSLGPDKTDSQSLCAGANCDSATATLQLRSDNQTDVLIYEVGRLGSFDMKSLELPPGRYTIVGTRDGYRDVRREFVLERGTTYKPWMIRCEEPI